MSKTLINQLFSIISIVVLMLLVSLPAKAQDQIVTDPTLNEALNNLEQIFPEFIQSVPELTQGATPELDLAGSKGSLSFAFQQTEGTFKINFDSLKFTPTNPISANKFNIVLTAKNIELAGQATIMVMADGKQFTLNCPDSQFSLGPLTFTAQAELGGDLGINVTDPTLDFDPNSISTSMPCLESSNAAATTNKVLKKLRTALKASARKPSSSVTKTTRQSFMALSSAITFQGLRVKR